MIFLLFFYSEYLDFIFSYVLIETKTDSDITGDEINDEIFGVPVPELDKGYLPVLEDVQRFRSSEDRSVYEDYPSVLSPIQLNALLSHDNERVSGYIVGKIVRITDHYAPLNMVPIVRRKACLVDFTGSTTVYIMNQMGYKFSRMESVLIFNFVVKDGNVIVDEESSIAL